MSYAEFLAKKKRVWGGAGMTGSVLPDALFDWQRALVRWALKKGRAALFEECGLGKTFQQIEWARLSGDTALIVAPLAVCTQTVREAATGFVLAHNHPSGDPEPSSADLRITRQLRTAADTLEIRLHDHLILGDPAIDRAGLGYYSFKRGGHL